jgi:tRNA A37 threonylcarbamoyltransferase TsaD
LSNVVANQLIHTQYGVVPELASRASSKNVPVIDASPNKHCKRTIVSNSIYSRSRINGSLLVGSSFAKSMA